MKETAPNDKYILWCNPRGSGRARFSECFTRKSITYVRIQCNKMIHSMDVIQRHKQRRRLFENCTYYYILRSRSFRQKLICSRTLRNTCKCLHVLQTIGREPRVQVRVFMNIVTKLQRRGVTSMKIFRNRRLSRFGIGARQAYLINHQYKNMKN